MSRLPTTKDCPECGSRKRDAKGSQFFKVWDPCCPSKSGFNHNEEGWTSKKKRISITIHARGRDELSVAQLDLGPRPVIFEKPQAKNYKHFKASYLKGYINGRPVNKILVDTGAAVNIMLYSVLRRLGRSAGDLIKTNVTLSDFNSQTSEAQGVLSVDLTGGNKTVLTSFFNVNSKSTYNVLLSRDWIHANCCFPSTMHQCLIQWDGDEVEVVHADDSIEISHAAMSIWDAEDQEPISGISLEGCDRIEATKNGVRLVLSTGLIE
jgi:hypothetical protein